MNYVEWLRVRNAARTLAIVLGVMLALGLMGRIWVALALHNGVVIVDDIKKDPGVTTTHSMYRGHNRTTIVDPHKDATVTIDDRPDGGKLITVVEPKRDKQNDTVNEGFGSVTVSSTEGPIMRTTMIDTDAKTPFNILLIGAYVAGLVMATVFGAALARENNGHLEFAMLRPVPRERFALGVIFADLCGILICEALAVVALIVGQFFFEIPHYDFTGVTPVFVAAIVLIPLSWYAMLNAASASLKRGAGAILGFAWPVAAVVVELGQVKLGDSAISQTIHAIFHTLAYIIPLNYASLNMHDNGTAITNVGNNIIAATLLLLIYGALTIVQWRRVEA